MSKRSVLSRVLKPSRVWRRRRRRVASVSEFVGKLADAGQAQPAPPSWIAAVPSSPVFAECGGRSAPQGSISRQLEAENVRLKRMAGDLMLQTEILRATMRRQVREESLMAAS